jgi:hypothetical protein
LEIRLINQLYVVVKSNRNFTQRLYQVLIDKTAVRGVRLRWASNGRLEFQFRNASLIWNDLEHIILPLLVNGETYGRCPGEEGGAIEVTYVEPDGVPYSYRPASSITYPQFTKCSEWVDTQTRLFGSYWDKGDERTLHN